MTFLLVILMLIAVLALIGNLMISMQMRDRLDAIAEARKAGDPVRKPAAVDARPEA